MSMMYIADTGVKFVLIEPIRDTVNAIFSEREIPLEKMIDLTSAVLGDKVAIINTKRLTTKAPTVYL